jgi:hypothetical protein
MGTKSREIIYGASVRAAAEQAADARETADRLVCEAWNKRMLAFQGPAQPSPALADALNAGYLYLEVKCLGCSTHQTVALNIVRRPKSTPMHELERYMRCKDCSRLQGRPYKRSHLIALRQYAIIAAAFSSRRTRFTIRQLACRRRPAYPTPIGQQIVHRLAIVFGTSAIDAFYGDRDRAFSILVTRLFSFRRPGIRDLHHGEIELQAYSADQGLKGDPSRSTLCTTRSLKFPVPANAAAAFFRPGQRRARMEANMPVVLSMMFTAC